MTTNSRGSNWRCLKDQLDCSTLYIWKRIHRNFKVAFDPDEMPRKHSHAWSWARNHCYSHGFEVIRGKFAFDQLMIPVKHVQDFSVHEILLLKLKFRFQIFKFGSMTSKDFPSEKFFLTYHPEKVNGCISVGKYNAGYVLVFG